MKQERIGAVMMPGAPARCHIKPPAAGCLWEVSIHRTKIYLFAIVGQLIEFLGKAKEGKQSEKKYVLLLRLDSDRLVRIENIGRLLTAIE